ncbi:MAG: endonuclease/exonuclease/phosphatase family protein [Planctomycetota bacterium]
MFSLREANDRVCTAHRRLVAMLASAALAIACSTPRPHDDAPLRAQGSLRVVAYNIRHGHGADDAVDLQRVATVLESLEPDIVLLQEVDHGCARSGSVDQARRLGDLLNMASAFGPFRPYDGGLYGMAALSRFPILHQTVVPLPPGPNPLSSLELRVAAPFGPCVVAGLHLVQTENQRLSQADFLVERYAASADPVILAGDLNSERGSSVLKSLARAFVIPGKSGERDTFPAIAPVKEIDFVLLSRTFDWQVSSSFTVAETLASDHRPVVLDVSLATAPPTRPPAPRLAR